MKWKVIRCCKGDPKCSMWAVTNGTIEFRTNLRKTAKWLAEILNNLKYYQHHLHHHEH